MLNPLDMVKTNIAKYKHVHGKVLSERAIWNLSDFFLSNILQSCEEGVIKERDD